MPYCCRCGVEVDPSVPSCPLCGTAVPVFDDLEPGEPAWPSSDHPGQNLTPTYASTAEVRRRAFVLVAGVLAVAALVVAVTDALIAGTITWSRWPLASLAAVLALTAGFLLWYRSPVRWGLASAVILAGFQATLDSFDGAWTWFPSLGLPMVVVTFGLGFALVAALRSLKRRGYNVFGVSFGLVALELVALDLLITGWTGAPLIWGWSRVTTLVLGALSLVFFVLHLGAKKTPDLGRIFHF